MISILEKLPNLEEYKMLRNSADWNLAKRSISDERAESSLDNSPFCVCAYDDNKIVGMARISGDLQMYGYVQDVIVLPEYQGKGIGKGMMKKVIEKVSGLEGYLLGVCPSKVSVRFYEGFGFHKRPEDPNGFMSLEINS